MRKRPASLRLVGGFLAFAAAAGVLFCADRAKESASNDERVVASLDIQYQEAVKKNDVATMGRLLADDFVLVTGRGRTQSKQDLLKESASGEIIYEHQEDTDRTVRMWGDSAVVTALLWAKGEEKGKSFEYKLWFSDFYMRTPAGWRYVFGQAAQPLSANP